MRSYTVTSEETTDCTFKTSSFEEAARKWTKANWNLCDKPTKMSCKVKSETNETVFATITFNENSEFVVELSKQD